MFPTDDSLPQAIARMEAHLPITDPAELRHLLCIFQNTWLTTGNH